MVRAILAGTKTQTRRMVKPVKFCPIWGSAVGHEGGAWLYGSPAALGLRDRGDHWSIPIRGDVLQRMCTEEAYGWGAGAGCPYGVAGDRLWVRESWQYANWTEEGEPYIRYAADDAQRLVDCGQIPEEWIDRLEDKWAGLSTPANYAIDNRAADRRWRPSIHMPRWASRITLEITDVRVQRLQDITYEDAEMEGVCCDMSARTFRDHFHALWDRINGAGAWNANPWVWALTFRRATAP
jgi:hypothetical protein